MRKLSRPGHTVGLPPGTLKSLPVADDGGVAIQLLAYDRDTLVEHRFERVEDCLRVDTAGLSTWINVEGVHDIETIQALGERYALHPLMLEDVVNTVQRPKVERFDDAVFVVVRMLEFNPRSEEIHSLQVSLVLTGGTLLSFVEHRTDAFEGVRGRIRSGRGRVRSTDTAYLAYALLDTVVDHYFLVLEQIGEHMESLDEALSTDPGPQTLGAIHRLKRELIYLRKSVWPLRETIAAMMRDETLPFHDEVRLYLRDLHDHTIQVIDTIESYRDLNAGMLETHLSMISNRMNEVMKVLTVIATLFIPLTFLVGVYGMNFEHMPELHLRWGYPTLWLVMVATTALMLRFFRRKGWI